MRFYDIKFQDPDGALLQDFGLARQGFQTTYTSFLNGQTIPGALNIEFNIPQAPWAIPQQGSWLRIWGSGLDEASGINKLSPFMDGNDIKLNGIVISAGMKAGLPLAKPEQAGVIVQGSIFQPFGNWQYTNQYIEMVLLPAVGITAGQQINIPFNYPKGTQVSDAIKQSLAGALPNYTIKVFVSPQLVLPYDANGSYQALSQFATMLLKLSNQSAFAGITTLGGGKYAGINVKVIGNTVTVYDGTVEYNDQNTFADPKAIAYEDIIGQPMWIGPASVNFKTVLRADVNVGDFITLPQQLAVPYVLTAPGASVPGAPSRSNAAFQGKWVVVNKRSYANFRNANADSWCSVFNVSTVQQPGALISGINAIPPGRVIVGQPVRAT